MSTIQPEPDVILCASDGQTFHCWKAFLSICSPFFKDMFTLPQPQADGSDDELSTIDLAEGACTLNLIVVISHPPSLTGKQFKIMNIRELGSALEAATKYDMESLRDLALKELSSPLLLHEDPLRIYALACQYGCRDVIQMAAKHTLALPTLIRQQSVPELENLGAGDLYRLMSYRDACVAAACALVDDHTWIVYTNFLHLFECTDDEDREWTTVRCPPSRKYPRGRLENMAAHGWWAMYMKKSKQALSKSPRGDTVKNTQLTNDIFSLILSSKKEQCKELHAWKAFLSFVDIFAETIESRVAEVEISGV